MNPRERMLAAVVGGLVALVALWFPFSWYTGALAQRRTNIAELEKKVADQRRKLEASKRAQQEILQLEERSLPYDKQNPELARSLYQTWLLSEIEKVHLEDPKVNPLAVQDRVAYQAHGFTISGRASLAQVTQLLYDFYSAPYLHTIRSLRLRPTKENSKQLELALTVEAISLPGAAGTKTLPPGKSTRLAGDLAAYTQAIVGRNLFGPPNNAPKFASVGTQKAYVGRSFSVSLKASDADKDDTLTYALEPGAPRGARVDARSGEFHFSPTAQGTFTAAVRVADSGTPAKSDTVKFDITVTDPPPPPRPTPVAEAPKKPSFDAARYTYVTSIAQDREGRWEVWLKVRTTDQTIKVREGDKIDIGGFQGEVVRIAAQDVELKSGGKRLLVALGENLDQAQTLPSGDL